MAFFQPSSEATLPILSSKSVTCGLAGALASHISSRANHFHENFLHDIEACVWDRPAGSMELEQSLGGP